MKNIALLKLRYNEIVLLIGEYSMKRIITFLAMVLVIYMIPSSVLSQGGQGTQMGQQQVGIGVGGGIVSATQSLNRVTTRMNNPEVGQQIRTMVQAHEQIQARTETALQQMDQRNQAVKLLIGPDYKNAGQVRSDVVALQNDIKQLETIKEDASTTDAKEIDTAIAELQTEASNLETQIATRVSGFSLFGWLARLLAR